MANVIPMGGANMVRSIPAFVNTYDNYDILKAIVILLDDDYAARQLASVTENIRDQLKHSAVPIRSLILYKHIQSEDAVKGNLNQFDAPDDLITNQLDTFLLQISIDDEDPELLNPDSVLQGILADSIWDYENRTVELDDYEDDHLSPLLTSLEELITYLNERLVKFSLEDMPLEVIKEFGPIDYEDAVREYLQFRNSEEIEKMGWDIDIL